MVKGEEVETRSKYVLERSAAGNGIIMNFAEDATAGVLVVAYINVEKTHKQNTYLIQF